MHFFLDFTPITQYFLKDHPGNQGFRSHQDKNSLMAEWSNVHPETVGPTCDRVLPKTTTKNYNPPPSEYLAFCLQHPVETLQFSFLAKLLLSWKHEKMLKRIKLFNWADGSGVELNMYKYIFVK